MKRRVSWRRLLAFSIAAILLAGILAPALNADRYRPQIERALESALNRRVTIRAVHFNLFTGPGFSLEDVLIEDHPSAGIEPFAHVDLVRARVDFATLLAGHLAFSHLTLVEPSVNFVKTDTGGWNFQPLLARVSAAGHPPIPEIQISSGRLNFKFGDTKSVFYIDDADLVVFLNDQRDLVIRFSGEAARTDHRPHGLGLLVARGALRSRPGAEEQVDMSVQLERTAINELIKLIEARDIGVRGSIASTMKLSGPLSHIAVSGGLRIDDIHRWDLMPNRAESWDLRYGGFLDLRNQRIDINTTAANNGNAPVTVSFAASHYLTAPQWTASLVLHQLPAGSLLETARHFGAPFPPGAILDGKVDGEVGYARGQGVQASLVMTDASIKFPQGGVASFDTAPVRIANNELNFGPANIDENDQTAVLEARYAFNTRALSFRITAPLLSITETKNVADRLLGTGPLPLLSSCRQGAWKGWMGFERLDDGPSIWSGEYDLQSTQIDLPGLAAPLRLASATVSLQPGQAQFTRIRGRVGDIPIEGEYRRYFDAEQPDRVRLSVGRAQISELERVFMPTLVRQEGFLARTFRLKRLSPPDWLKERQIEGSLQIGDLLFDDVSLGAAKARIAWNGTHIQFPGLDLRLNETVAAGRLALNVSGPLPQYRFAGKLTSLEYRNGELDLAGVLETAGTGAALLRNVQSDGTFSATGIELSSDTEVDAISGEFHILAGAVMPHLSLTNLQVTQGQNVLHGQGVSQADGRIILDLTNSARHPIRLTGMLLPVRVASPAP